MNFLFFIWIHLGYEKIIGVEEWLVNPFSASVPFLYPLKTSESQRFSDVFRGYRNGRLA